MLMPIDELLPLLRSPTTRERIVVERLDGRPVSCAATLESGAQVTYPIVDGIPVLVDFENSVLDRDATLRSAAASPVRRRTGPLWRLARRIAKGTNTVAAAKCREIMAMLRLPAAVPATADRRARMVVVGGGTIGEGAEELYAAPDIGVIGFDIYASPNIQVIADAHQIPLADESADAVWIQAVLEHVVEPSRVVAEIARILRPGGLVYAETPFMQQVHEGAFDFGRFSQSGHRWLFRSFERIDDGVVAGPGVALQWSIRYFVAGLLRSRLAGAVAATLFLWLRWFDTLIDARHASDGASCLFFFGRKREHSIVPADVIAAYAGAQR